MAIRCGNQLSASNGEKLLPKIFPVSHVLVPLVEMLLRCCFHRFTVTVHIMVYSLFEPSESVDRLSIDCR